MWEFQARVKARPDSSEDFRRALLQNIISGKDETEKRRLKLTKDGVAHDVPCSQLQHRHVETLIVIFLEGGIAN